jgi:hypothetical protein
MAATIGVSSTFLAFVTPGTGTVIEEVTSDASREVKTVKSSSGVTVQAAQVPMTETKISVKGKGIPLLSLAAAGTAGVMGSAITSGTVVITGVSVDETQDDYPSFSIDAMKWS